MTQYLDKLRPDRDLQCYFERPSAIAALSETSSTGFTLSGCWRQQFDWAVVEWTRDNIFDHPVFRALPDGDLSGLRLSYEETRRNCFPLDSTWLSTIDWRYLRIWAEDASGKERLYYVPLYDPRHATPIEGGFEEASATFELKGTITGKDYVELAWLDEHYTYFLLGDDTPEKAVLMLANAINEAQGLMSAKADGAKITLAYSRSAGANGNRIGVFGNVSGAKTEEWSPSLQMLSGGKSPSRWLIDLDFGSLVDRDGTQVPMRSVRKMRWTWMADIQSGSFARTEFDVTVSNWTVTGGNRRYRIAGPGSFRVEDDSTQVSYSPDDELTWKNVRGNYSGGSIRYSEKAGTSVTCRYTSTQDHTLYLGTRRAPNAARVIVTVDDRQPVEVNLALEDDVLVRLPLGEFEGGRGHTVAITHSDANGMCLYFDFLEIALPTEALPEFPPDPQLTLATDWDTDHSLALAPERTAWLINSLGFTGRANHYTGAIWFYELTRPGHCYAKATVTFTGAPVFSQYTDLAISTTVIRHLNLVGDTASSIAKAFELLINAGSNSVWAQAADAVLTIYARAMGTAGNGIAVDATTTGTGFSAEVSGPTSGGEDGDCRAALESTPDSSWATDLDASPRLNRAARDWSRSFFKALKGYGIDVTSAFSMELRHGNPSQETGIAQRYPDGSPVWVSTPALQTNFSPASTDFWKQVYADMAELMVEAGQKPYLQFGEVQWWYFPAPGIGMPFYDDYTKSAFQAKAGRDLRVFFGDEQPSSYPMETGFLADLVGTFTVTIIDHVRQTYPEASFEVLYAPDVNEAPLIRAVNLPTSAWNPQKLACFKTENFTYTGDRDLNRARTSIELPEQLGFAQNQCSHLIGVGDYTTPWDRECSIAKGEGMESVVLFALDQFCFIGYPVPLKQRSSRSAYQG